MCKWEGNAAVRFKFSSKDNINSITLNSNSQFQQDTNINGYQIELIEVNPYPDLDKPIVFEDYWVKILIRSN